MYNFDYYNEIIDRNLLKDELTQTEECAFDFIHGELIDWRRGDITDIKLSGSRAKGTAIKGTCDLDIFVSFSSTTKRTLEDLYNDCYELLKSKFADVRKQNVSIGVKVFFELGEKDVDPVKIDVVPARRIDQYGGDHNLFKNKSRTWTKTNIDKHISQVKKSGRQRDIAALKIWREINKVEFPSIYLECFALKALSGYPIESCESNFYHLLYSIRREILNSNIYDPANSANNLSNDLSYSEKQRLASLAGRDYNRNIEDVLYERR